MKQDSSKKNGDQHQPIDSQGDGAGASGHKYKLGVNGVTIAVSSETGMVTARELLKSAEKAKALVTVLDAKTVLVDDDHMYEGDEEVNLEEARTFIAVSKYEGTDTFLERIRHLLPDDSVYHPRGS